MRLPMGRVPARALVLFAAFVSAFVLLAAVPSSTAGAAPPPAITNISAFLEGCPTNDPMYAQIRADFEIRREGVPVGAIPCTEPISAMPIAQYTDELIAVQALRAIYYMEGGRNVAYPWASGSLYDWMKGEIGGINISNSGSYCCESYDGEWFPSIVAQNQYDRDDARVWQGISYRITTIAHETRHVDGFPHVGGCPLFPTVAYGCDQTYSEANLSPYGIAWWLNAKWLSGELNAGYSCLPEADNIADWHLRAANDDFQGRFVTNAPPILSMPAQPGGPCAGASPTVTFTPAPTASPSASPTPTPTHSPTPTPTPTASPTLTATPSLSPTLPSTPSPTATPTVTPSGTASATPTVTSTVAPTATPSPTSTSLATTSPTSSLSPPQGPTFTPSPTPTSSPSPTDSPTPTEAPGDANCDGDVDAFDGLDILRHFAGLIAAGSGSCGTPAPALAREWGDMDCDGDADALDVLAILHQVGGFPADEACLLPA